MIKRGVFKRHVDLGAGCRRVATSGGGRAAGGSLTLDCVNPSCGAAGGSQVRRRNSTEGQRHSDTEGELQHSRVGASRQL